METGKVVMFVALHTRLNGYNLKQNQDKDETFSVITKETGKVVMFVALHTRLNGDNLKSKSKQD